MTELIIEPKLYFLPNCEETGTILEPKLIRISTKRLIALKTKAHILKSHGF